MPLLQNIKCMKRSKAAQEATGRHAEAICSCVNHGFRQHFSFWMCTAKAVWKAKYDIKKWRMKRRKKRKRRGKGSSHRSMRVLPPGQSRPACEAKSSCPPVCEHYPSGTDQTYLNDTEYARSLLLQRMLLRWLAEWEKVTTWHRNATIFKDLVTAYCLCLIVCCRKISQEIKVSH